MLTDISIEGDSPNTSYTGKQLALVGGMVMVMVMMMMMINADGMTIPMIWWHIICTIMIKMI